MFYPQNPLPSFQAPHAGTDRYYHDLHGVTGLPKMTGAPEASSELLSKSAKHTLSKIRQKRGTANGQKISEIIEGERGDLKSQKPYKNKSMFVYSGEVVNRDALGNLMFGYLGEYYGIPTAVLRAGAGYAQLRATGFNPQWALNLFDDPRDTVRAKQGQEVYKKYHPDD